MGLVRFLFKVSGFKQLLRTFFPPNKGDVHITVHFEVEASRFCFRDLTDSLEQCRYTDMIDIKHSGNPKPFYCDSVAAVCCGLLWCVCDEGERIYSHL